MDAIEKELANIDILNKKLIKLKELNPEIISEYEMLLDNLEKQKKEAKNVLSKLFKEGKISEGEYREGTVKAKIFTRKTSVFDPADTFVKIGVDNFIKVAKVDSRQLKMDFPELADEIKKDEKVSVTVKI